MDFNALIARVTAILTSPKTEWPKIAERAETPAGLYTGYVAILAAIPVVCLFVKMSLFGIHIPLGGTFRVGFGAGLIGALVRYVLSLVGVFILALIIDALAPNFGGTKNQTQALKVAAYSYTAYWVSGIGLILPGIGFLITLAGGIYSLYLLYLGLPVMMKAPADKATGYTAFVIVLAIVIGFLLGIIANTLHMGGMSGMMPGGGLTGREEGHFDKDSTLGKLEDWSKNVETASKNLDAAQKSGDTEAQQKAMSQVMGSVFSGGAVVESLAPERIKAFLPDSLLGLTRKDASAERNAAMGMQISNARATYTDGAQKSLNVEITDMGSAKGFAAAASWAGLEQDKETDTGYEKTYKAGGRTMHEQWDNQSKDGEYSVIVGERFAVKVSGGADSIDTLKSMAQAIDLPGLEALKGEGVKQGG